ncbi:hypothetical protein DY000_02017129 [Brassica cretica]|uniref:Tryptophan synthase n=1 Tax=Brassica cretica TaxID=69181 RepID=A0ABQ7CPP8_BRACR|nr:hypothetical protein DY000_02017129 [Brassica cretica]
MAASGTVASFRTSVSSSPQLTHLRSPSKALKFTPLPSSRSRPSFSVSCTIAKDPPVLMSAGSDPTLWQRPDSFGRFGKFGGKYVPETLMHALSELETAFHSLATDDDFQVSSPKNKPVNPHMLTLKFRLQNQLRSGRQPSTLRPEQLPHLCLKSEAVSSFYAAINVHGWPPCQTSSLKTASTKISSSHHSRI